MTGRLERLAIRATDRKALGREKVPVVFSSGRPDEVVKLTAVLLAAYSGDTHLTANRDRALTVASEGASNASTEPSSALPLAVAGSTTTVLPNRASATEMVKPGTERYDEPWRLVGRIEPHLRALVGKQQGSDGGPNWCGELPRRHPTLLQHVLRMRERGAVDTTDLLNHSGLSDLTTIMSGKWNRFRRALGGTAKQRLRRPMFKFNGVRKKLAHNNPVPADVVDAFTRDWHEVIKLMNQTR